MTVPEPSGHSEWQAGTERHLQGSSLAKSSDGFLSDPSDSGRSSDQALCQTLSHKLFVIGPLTKERWRCDERMLLVNHSSQ